MCDQMYSLGPCDELTPVLCSDVCPGHCDAGNGHRKQSARGNQRDIHTGHCVDGKKPGMDHSGSRWGHNLVVSTKVWALRTLILLANFSHTETIIGLFWMH